VAGGVTRQGVAGAITGLCSRVASGAAVFVAGAIAGRSSTAAEGVVGAPVVEIAIDTWISLVG